MKSSTNIFSICYICNISFCRPVLAKQIIIHQNPCSELANSSVIPIESSLTSILVYVVDENGKFDATMTKILPSLYKVSPFPMRVS